MFEVAMEFTSGMAEVNSGVRGCSKVVVFLLEVCKWRWFLIVKLSGCYMVFEVWSWFVVMREEVRARLFVVVL